MASLANQQQQIRANAAAAANLFINPNPDMGIFNAPHMSFRERYAHLAGVELNDNQYNAPNRNDYEAAGPPGPAQFIPGPSDPGDEEARYDRSVYDPAKPGPSGLNPYMRRPTAERPGRRAAVEEMRRAGLGAEAEELLRPGLGVEVDDEPRHGFGNGGSNMGEHHMYGPRGPIAFVSGGVQVGMGPDNRGNRDHEHDYPRPAPGSLSSQFDFSSNSLRADRVSALDRPSTSRQHRGGDPYEQYDYSGIQERPVPLIANPRGAPATVTSGSLRNSRSIGVGGGVPFDYDNPVPGPSGLNNNNNNSFNNNDNFRAIPILDPREDPKNGRWCGNPRGAPATITSASMQDDDYSDNNEGQIHMSTKRRHATSTVTSGSLQEHHMSGSGDMGDTLAGQYEYNNNGGDDEPVPLVTNQIPSSSRNSSGQKTTRPQWKMPDAVVNCISRMLNLLFTLMLNHIALPADSGHEKQRIGSAIKTIKTDPRYPEALKVFNFCLKNFSQMMSLKGGNQDNTNNLDSPSTTQTASQSAEKEPSNATNKPSSDKPQCENKSPCHHQLALQFAEFHLQQTLAFIYRDDILIVHKPHMQKLLNVDKDGKPLPPKDPSDQNPAPEDPIIPPDPFAPPEDPSHPPDLPPQMEQMMGQLFMAYLGNLNNSLQTPQGPLPMPRPDLPFPTNPFQEMMANEPELLNCLLSGLNEGQVPHPPPMPQATAAAQPPLPNGSISSVSAASLIVQANQILRAANLPLLDFNVRQAPAVFQQNSEPVGGLQTQEPEARTERQQECEEEPMAEGEAESEARSEADREADMEEEQEGEKEAQQETEREVEQDVELVEEPEAEPNMEWVEEQVEPETESGVAWVEDGEVNWEQQGIGQEPEQDSTSSSCYPVTSGADKGPEPAN